MINETSHEQSAIHPADELRQYADGLFRDIEGVRDPHHAEVRYVRGEKDHIVRFSQLDFGKAYRIEYRTSPYSYYESDNTKYYRLDEYGADDPSTDGYIGTQDATSRRISQLILDAVEVSSSTPLNRLGRTILKISSRRPVDQSIANL